jgi:NitT/TauT family transport system ATP-binding protein/sulfonate transport system ATP-binding protein
VVLVTHLVEDAVRLADRAVTLRGRPARIVSDIVFDTPRRERTDADRTRLATRLATDIAATPAQVTG